MNLPGCFVQFLSNLKSLRRSRFLRLLPRRYQPRGLAGGHLSLVLGHLRLPLVVHPVVRDFAQALVCGVESLGKLAQLTTFLIREHLDVCPPGNFLDSLALDRH